MNLISRAQFLRGDWRGRKPGLRPPWALTEPAFSDRCDGCGKCVTACQERIIVMSPGKLPLLDFSRGGCTFCKACVAACEPAALQAGQATARMPWQLQARIADSCLARCGTSCARCIEACELDAIVARPVLGGRLKISIDLDTCSGCGMCIKPCPVDAISLNQPGGEQPPARQLSGEYV